MKDVIIQHMNGDNKFAIDEDNDVPYSGRLSSWEYSPSIKAPKVFEDLSPEEKQRVPIYEGPPRVLELGCGDGRWCFTVKQEHPDCTYCNHITLKIVEILTFAA
jgi:tRNA G46 methylase TrmB